MPSPAPATPSSFFSEAYRMATYAENLATTRDQIAANLVTITANPKPTYTIDGQTVSWTELFKAYTEQLEQLNGLLAAGDPFELESYGY